MYAVVGCRECDALWIVEGRPDTTRCRRCGTRHRFERLKAFHETDDEDEARQFRAATLAERQGEGDAFADLEDFASLERQAADGVVDDETYLADSGVDPAAVADAGERAARSGGSRSRREVVLEALREQDAPTEREVVTYAEARGVPAADARELLGKLHQAGEVTVRDGCYRLV